MRTHLYISNRGACAYLIYFNQYIDYLILFKFRKFKLRNLNKISNFEINTSN